MTDQKNFRYQHYVAVSGSPGGKVPVVHVMLSSHEQEMYASTSLHESSIEFEFQTGRKGYVDLRRTYLAIKTNLVKRRGFDNYKTTEKKHKRDRFFTETSDHDVKFIEEVGERVTHVTHVNNILHSFFLMRNFTLTTTKNTS